MHKCEQILKIYRFANSIYKIFTFSVQCEVNHSEGGGCILHILTSQYIYAIVPSSRVLLEQNLIYLNLYLVCLNDVYNVTAIQKV